MLLVCQSSLLPLLLLSCPEGLQVCLGSPGHLHSSLTGGLLLLHKLPLVLGCKLLALLCDDANRQSALDDIKPLIYLYTGQTVWAGPTAQKLRGSVCKCGPLLRCQENVPWLLGPCL